MADKVKLTVNITADDGILSTDKFKRAAKNGVTKVVPDMQKIMYNVTPVGNAFDGDKHPGRLREAWIKSVNKLPTYRVTTRKNGDIGVFLYNHAQDDQGREYAGWVNDGHESFNQFGGPYITYNGTTRVPGTFFMKTGVNRIKEDTSITSKIGANIAKELNRNGK